MRYFLQRLWERNIGMKLALWIDKHHPEWCWADICTNVGLGYDIHWLWRGDKSSRCKEDCALRGSCWCGKMMTPEFRAGFEKDQAEHADGKGFDL